MRGSAAHLIARYIFHLGRMLERGACGKLHHIPSTQDTLRYPRAFKRGNASRAPRTIPASRAGCRGPDHAVPVDSSQCTPRRCGEFISAIASSARRRESRSSGPVRPTRRTICSSRSSALPADSKRTTARETVLQPPKTSIYFNQMKSSSLKALALHVACSGRFDQLNGSRE
jgi:hypothetical protein